MGAKNKYLMDYRQREVLGAIPTPLDFMPKYFIEEEIPKDTIDPETIEELKDFNTAEDFFEQNEFKNNMRDVLNSLTPRESKVLRLRFGVDMPSDYTLDEIASMYDMTRERIRQIEAKALRKIRHPSRTDYLGLNHRTLWDRVNEKMPERDMEWGWTMFDEERHLEKLKAWEERVKRAVDLLEQAKIKLKESGYREL